MKKSIPAFAQAMHDDHYDDAYQKLLTEPSGLINPFDRHQETLDGEWHFCVDPYDTGIRKKWFDVTDTSRIKKEKPIDFDYDEWETVQVPSCFNMVRPEYFLYEGTAWYTRAFRFDPGAKSERVFLLLEGAQYECRVWLNGRYVARHLGGSTPFSVEITGVLQRENRLTILVNNARRADGVPAYHTDWFNYGGLYRSVSLIRVPDTFVKDAFLRLTPNGSPLTITASVEVGGQADACLIEIPELSVSETIPLEQGRGEIRFEAPVELWCLENPKLYDVIISCSGDSVTEKIGFREIRTCGRDILLNGKRLFLRGISFHEDHPTQGKMIRPEDVERFFSYAKELNCNFVRLAHYPHTRYAARLADRLGILLWEEIPVYWALDYSSEGVSICAQNQMQELILRDRNRASVIIWSIGNETPDNEQRQRFMSNMIRVCRATDGSRPVSAACLVNYESYRIEDTLTEEIDIIGINEYFGWYRGSMEHLGKELDNMSIEKPLIVTEFGAGALAGNHGGESELFTEECQARIYEEQMNTLLSRRDIVKGMTPWVLFDFRSPGRTNAYQRGYNRKGLMSPDCMQRKKAFYVLQKGYSMIEKEEGVPVRRGQRARQTDEGPACLLE